MIEELKFERPVHKDGPGRQLGGPKPDQDANLEAKSELRSPTWRSKSDLGGQLGGPKLTQEATLETQARKEANLDAQRCSRTPTWRPKGSPGGRLWRQNAAQDANLQPKWIEKRSQREPRGSKNEAREPTLANKAEMQKTMKNLIKTSFFQGFTGSGPPPKRSQKRSKSESGG